jgi:hypothetical protein
LRCNTALPLEKIMLESSSTVCSNNMIKVLVQSDQSKKFATAPT